MPSGSWTRLRERLARVRADAASGEDAPDRVRPLCGGKPRLGAGSASRRRSTSWASRTSAAAAGGASSCCGGKTRRDRMRAKLKEMKVELTAAQARDRSPEQGRWLGQVVGGFFGYHAVPTNSAALSAFRYHVDGPVAARAAAAQPEGPHHVGADRPAGGRLPAQTADPSPMAERPLRRHTPEVGAVCLNWARPVLCGGRAVMRVPTATGPMILIWQGYASDR